MGEITSIWMETIQIRTIRTRVTMSSLLLDDKQIEHDISPLKFQHSFRCTLYVRLSVKNAFISFIRTNQA